MYKSCIFDLDGTLINTLPALTHTMNLTLEKYGLGSIGDEQTKVFVGDGYQKFVERAIKCCGDANLSHLEDALETYDELFEENCLYHIEAYDGMRELLAYLKGEGIKIAVLTNKSHERAIDTIELVYGRGYFDLITGEREGTGRKPDPAGAFYTAKTLGVNVSDCLYFGDTNTDMKTGINAGMDTVGVTWGFREREELEQYHPKYLVDNPRDVITIIEETKQGD